MDLRFRVIAGKTAHRVIFSDIAACRRIVADAYLAHARGHSVNPNSHFLRFPERPNARIIALPAYLGGDAEVAGIKWIASFPDNIRRGVPRASAVLILNDCETGYPIACLESSIISAARTAASAVLAAEHLSPEGRRARRLGIVGTGLIARYTYEFLLALGWSIDDVLLFDLNSDESARFAATACRHDRHRSVAVVPDLPGLLRESELIVLTTVAGAPHIHDPSLLRHNPTVLHVSLRDLSPDIILGAQNVVDDVGHVLNANTSVHLTQQRVGGTGFIAGTLADLMRGELPLRTDVPRIFSPFGLGVLDLAVGRWVLDAAVAAGEFVEIPEFFYEMTR
ncbi:2,3-diaminopropionate biosynthesis protein SbnB [Nannocystis pusilla]|uniref:2,3-diaminopropionate biosynthesis protein SbnB n=1 Tax=Nannocystis pusilla TaxID=889268 RepID=UPI003B77DCE6